MVSVTDIGLVEMEGALFRGALSDYDVTGDRAALVRAAGHAIGALGLLAEPDPSAPLARVVRLRDLWEENLLGVVRLHRGEGS